MKVRPPGDDAIYSTATLVPSGMRFADNPLRSLPTDISGKQSGGERRGWGEHGEKGDQGRRNE
jgi:hypothetical protein